MQSDVCLSVILDILTGLYLVNFSQTDLILTGVTDINDPSMPPFQVPAPVGAAVGWYTV